MLVTESHQETAEVGLNKSLVRQNTFTKDSLEVSPEATARPASTEASQARLVTQAWNAQGDQVRLVGGRIVRSQGSTVTAASPRTARKLSGQNTMASSSESQDRAQLVRRKTWTKEEAALALAQAQARGETTRTEDSVKVENEFTGARKITSEEYQAGERFAVKKQEDHLKMEGDFVKMVPEKWEPGQRAAMVKHKDNLIPPGPVEDTRDKAPVGRGDRAPVTVHGDNLHLEGDFEQRTTEEFQAVQRAAAVRHPDSLVPAEGQFEVREPKAWAPGERNAVVKRSDNLQVTGEFEKR